MDSLTWIDANRSMVLEMLVEHMILTYSAIGIGLLIAVPLGTLCHRLQWLYGAVLGVTTTAFAIPSIALIIALMPITGISRLTAIIPLSLYAVVFLIRGVVAGADATEDDVRQAATAMGYGTMHRILMVDLWAALPFIIGSLRVAVVSTISMVSVVSVIGIPSLGDLFVDGVRRFYGTPIIVGIALTVLLAALSDVLLVIGQRIATPWAARGAQT